MPTQRELDCYECTPESHTNCNCHARCSHHAFVRASAYRVLSKRQRDVLDLLKARPHVGITPADRGYRGVSANNDEPQYHVGRATLQRLVDAGFAEWRSKYPEHYPDAQHYAVPTRKAY